MLLVVLLVHYVIGVIVVSSHWRCYWFVALLMLLWLICRVVDSLCCYWCYRVIVLLVVLLIRHIIDATGSLHC